MRNIKSKEDLSNLWDGEKPLICDFSATWCGPCQALGPVLKKLEKANPGIAFAKVDVDEQEELSGEHKVQSVPTIFFVKNGKVVKKIIGYKTYDDLSKSARRLLAE